MNKATVSGFLDKISGFFKNNFEASSSRRSRVTAIIVTAVLLLAAVADNGAFLSLETQFKWLLLATALMLPFAVGATVMFSLRITNERLNRIWHLIFLFVMPFPTITMTECLNKVFIYDMTYLGFFANYMLVLLLYLFFFAVTGSVKVPILAVNPLLYLLALTNSYVLEFRGTPFIPMDILGIKTATGVVSTYKFSVSATVLLATFIFIWIMIIGIKMKTPKYKSAVRIITRVFSGVFFVTLMSLFYFTSVLAQLGVVPDFWNQARGYHNYGFAFMFFCNTKYMYMSEPNGYNPDKVPEYIDEFIDSSDNKTQNKNLPNVICIMNESLSDLQTLGDFTVNEDYMPFMRSLTENTIKGNLYVPVIGAGTSNTEFEFITGHTTAFLPAGSNAYMLYVKNHIASLVSTLKSQGYSAFALHPYFAMGWNRTNVYNNLGFERFFSIESILNSEMMNLYRTNSGNSEYLQSMAEQYYPGENLLIRQYISDSYDYKTLIKDYENRDTSKPYFAFNVTMQNHGGYTTSCSNFNEDIYVTSSQNVYPKTNKYLSLVKYSDQAFEELINYFRQVKEPTIICMFGDHQPSVENDFIAEALGVENLLSLSIEQEQARHVTPFIIWANFDIEEQQIERLSANYLSSLLLKTAGLELTEYNKYLLKLSDLLPVIDTTGYIDRNGTYYRWSDHTEYDQILSEYEQIQYNNIFETNKKSIKTFYLDGYTESAAAETSSDPQEEQQ